MTNLRLASESAARSVADAGAVKSGAGAVLAVLLVFPLVRAIDSSLYFLGFLGVVLLLKCWLLSWYECIVVSAPVMFFTGATGPLHLAASDLLLPLFVIAVLLQLRQSEIATAVWPIALFSLLVATNIAASALSASLAPRGIVFSAGISNALKLIVGLSYAAFVAAWVLHQPIEKSVRSMRLWAWLASLFSLGSVLTEVAGIPVLPSDGHRSFGLFQDPNLYAGYLLLSLCIVLIAETLHSMAETPLMLMAMSGGVVMTASRSAVATLGLLLLFALVFLPMARVRLVLIPLGISGAWLSSQVLAGRANVTSIPALDRLFTSSQVVDADPRFSLWALALQLWESHPILGVGIGQFGTYSQSILGVSQGTGLGFIAHNTFLSFLAELGIIGLLLCIGGFAFLIAGVLRSSWLSPRTRAAFMLGIAAVAAQMGTLNLQNVRYVWIFFGIILGLLAKARFGTAPDPGSSKEGQLDELPLSDGAIPSARVDA